MDEHEDLLDRLALAERRARDAELRADRAEEEAAENSAIIWLIGVVLAVGAIGYTLKTEETLDTWEWVALVPGAIIFAWIVITVALFLGLITRRVRG